MSLKSQLQAMIPNRHPIRIVWHRTKGMIAAMRAGFPQKNLRIIGVTGTDGKTTTVGMIAHILRTSGKTVGAASTTFFRVNDEVRWNETHKTSVSPVEFQNFLKKCVTAHCEFAVVEASSHGLVQGRLGPIHPEVSVMTNTSLEHLDYHGTMEQYRLDKSILFRRLLPTGSKVINATDGSADILRAIPSAKTFLFSLTQKPEPSEGHSALWATDIAAGNNGVTARIQSIVDGVQQTHDCRLGIPGTYNVENALAAISACLAVGIPLPEAIMALESFMGIPGRLEKIDEGQAFGVYVDFAVTPLAYERALQAVRAIHPQGKLLVMASACGDRMKEKRPVIGEICSRLADTVVVTSDETLVEDPLQPIEDIWEGVTTGNADAEKVPDRRTAIRTLLRAAKPGDAVLLCGMGACQTMQTQSGLIPWDERMIAREILRELAKA